MRPTQHPNVASVSAGLSILEPNEPQPVVERLAKSRAAAGEASRRVLAGDFDLCRRVENRRRDAGATSTRLPSLIGVVDGRREPSGENFAKIGNRGRDALRKLRAGPRHEAVWRLDYNWGTEMIMRRR